MDCAIRIGSTTIDTGLAGILSDAGIGLWNYDGTSGRFSLDATCCVLFDLDPDPNLGRELLRERIHPEDLLGYVEAVRAAIAGGGQFAVDYRIVRRDGSVRFISSRGRVRSQLPGEPVSISGVCIDVTERRRLEQQLHATELQMRTLADSFPGLFCYVDRNYIVRFLSNRYLEHIGGSREELIGRPLAELTGPEKFSQRKAQYDRAMLGISDSFEDSRQMPDGSERHYAITYHPDRGLDGEVRGFMAIGLDITELRRIERALQERSIELSRSNQDLEQFAYVASHDLKAPLRAIEALIGWLGEDLAAHDEARALEHLALLGQRATRLNRLLDDLLAYSRAGRLECEAMEIDSRQLVLDIAALLGPPPAMRIEADASLPVLRTYAAPLEQVLRNLINNAIKHHPTGNGLVRVSAETRPGEVMFSVEDDGAGIPPESAAEVFEMFRTLRPRDEVEGSGMGLAIVKRLVELHGGRVWFQPGRGGRGTDFRFTWKPEAEATPASSPRRAASR